MGLPELDWAHRDLEPEGSIPALGRDQDREQDQVLDRHRDSRYQEEHGQRRQLSPIWLVVPDTYHSWGPPDSAHRGGLSAAVFYARAWCCGTGLHLYFF